MRTTFRSIPIATVALLGTVAAGPAGAQQSTTAAPRAARADTAATSAVRPLAVYRLAAPNGAGFPAEVTVSDSAGRLVASFRAPGLDAQPMRVLAEGSDLLLSARTPAGLLLLALPGQNDEAATGGLVGRWVLGERTGELHGASTLATGGPDRP